MEKETNKEKNLDDVEISKITQEIDSQIDTERNKIKKIDAMQSDIALLNQKMTNCIELFSKSISGVAVNSMFEDMQSTNRTFCKNTLNALEEESQSSKIRISNLINEKDELLKAKMDDE